MKRLHEDRVDLEFIDHVLVARYKAGPTINLAMAREILKQRLEFTDFKEVPVLVIDAGAVTMEKSARDFLSSPAGTQGIKASAIISTSMVNSMLVNFILRISKPNMPVRMFTSQPEAIAWLKTYLDESG